MEHDRAPLVAAPPRSHRMLARGGATHAVVAVVLTAQVGCLSHEYVIPNEELSRLASSPPERRGERLRAVQEIGIRRGPALDPNLPPPMPAPGGPIYTDRGVVDSGWHSHVYVGGGFSYGGGGGRRGPRSAPPATAVASPVGPQNSLGSTAPAGTPLPTPPPTAPAGVSPPAAAPTTGGAVPRARSGGGSSDDLVAYAVVAAAVAALAAVGAGVTEGMRFDGDIAAAPQQYVYLQDERGGERAVPLWALTPTDLAGTEKAVLRDDEGYGLVRIERAPLNRRGFAFKVDAGSLSTEVGDTTPWGFASHIQAGYFPHKRLGLLVGVALAGTTGEDGFARHAVTAEAQVFPLNLWRLHLGGAFYGGSAVAPRDLDGGEVWGVPILGGAAILEIELTTRLALTARFDWSTARTSPSNWSQARSISAGLAIY
ncbi:MAG TPA: hypothetical protein VGG33_07520 [Polyangia bacterium]